MTTEDSPEGRLSRFRGLEARLNAAVLGQERALSALTEALLSGEMGHTPPGRPRSILLLLGPTGTGKTSSVVEASRHLFGTDSVAKLNGAEFSTRERMAALLGSGGLLVRELARARKSGGRILLIDEIEKAHPGVAEHLLGMEGGSLGAADERVSLEDLHVVATSNVGSSGIVEMSNLSEASVRRYVEQEASSHFRPEVLARFTAVVTFFHLSREKQVAICRAMLDAELELQSGILCRRLGHPHRVDAGDGVFPLLVSQGWHRRLGARPMRNVVERRVRAALVDAQLSGILVKGVPRSVLVPDAGGRLRVAPGRDPIEL